MAKWGIWFFVIGRRTLTPDLGENGVKTLVCITIMLPTGKKRERFANFGNVRVGFQKLITTRPSSFHSSQLDHDDS
jgi:hypothetical protein